MAAQHDSKFPLEIINAGFYRGGTSSLALALDQLGFGPVWHLITNSEELTARGSKWWVENDVPHKLNNDIHVNFDEWLHLIQCKSISDFPIVFYWDKIFAQYPHAKVIVSMREFDKWSKSYTNALSHIDSTGFKLAGKSDPFSALAIKTWNFKHRGERFNNVAELLALDDAKRNSILQQDYYDGFIEKIKSIVPIEQLLVFNPSDGWKPLCDFLNVDVPDAPYPNVNNTKELNDFVYNWNKQIFKKHMLSYIHQPPLVWLVAFMAVLVVFISFI